MSRQLTRRGQLQSCWYIACLELGLAVSATTEQDFQLHVMLHEFLAGADKGGYMVKVPDLESQMFRTNKAAVLGPKAF